MFCHWKPLPGCHLSKHQGNVISTSMEITNFVFFFFYCVDKDTLRGLVEIQLYSSPLGNEICQHNLVLLIPYWILGLSTLYLGAYKWCLTCLSYSFLLEKLPISSTWCSPPTPTHQPALGWPTQLCLPGTCPSPVLALGVPHPQKPLDSGKPGWLVTQRPSIEGVICMEDPSAHFIHNCHGKVQSNGWRNCRG